MAVRRDNRNPKKWVIDFRYRAKGGKKKRWQEMVIRRDQECGPSGGTETSQLHRRARLPARGSGR